MRPLPTPKLDAPSFIRRHRKLPFDCRQPDSIRISFEIDQCLNGRAGFEPGRIGELPQLNAGGLHESAEIKHFKLAIADHGVLAPAQMLGHRIHINCAETDISGSTAVVFLWNKLGTRLTPRDEPMPNDTQERYSLTWKVTPDMLGILSADARFEATNPAWFATLGWTAEEIEERPFFDFIHPDDITRTEEAFLDIQEGKPILQFVNRYRHTNGEYRWLSWNCVPEAEKFYCSARDVTQNLENKMALATKEEEARLREQFIAVLGHDLRNPLAALQSGFRLLAKEENLSERGQSVIDASHRTVDRMSGLVDDLMDFARTRLGSGLSLQRSDGSDLAAALEATVEEIRAAHPG